MGTEKQQQQFNRLNFRVYHPNPHGLPTTLKPSSLATTLDENNAVCTMVRAVDYGDSVCSPAGQSSDSGSRVHLATSLLTGVQHTATTTSGTTMGGSHSHVGDSPAAAGGGIGAVSVRGSSSSPQQQLLLVMLHTDGSPTSSPAHDSSSLMFGGGEGGGGVVRRTPAAPPPALGGVHNNSNSAVYPHYPAPTVASGSGGVEPPRHRQQSPCAKLSNRNPQSGGAILPSPPPAPLHPEFLLGASLAVEGIAGGGIPSNVAPPPAVVVMDAPLRFLGASHGYPIATDAGLGSSSGGGGGQEGGPRHNDSYTLHSPNALISTTAWMRSAPRLVVPV